MRHSGFLLVVAIVCLAVVHLVPTPAESLLWFAVLDAGHAALFGMFALLLLRLLPSLPGLRGATRAQHYLLGFTIATAASVLGESLQYFGPRSAEVADVLRSAAGASAVLLAATAFDRKLRHSLAGKRRFQAAALGLACLLVAGAFAHALAVGVAYLQRDAAFPQLCGFESSWEKRFVGVQDAALERTEPPEAWALQATASELVVLGQRVGLVTFRPGPFPGLFIREPAPDWTAYDRLLFEVYSELDAPATLTLRIHDAHHDNQYADRFNSVLVIVPGPNHVAIPLSQVHDAPRGRAMDMAHIAGLALFTITPPESFSLYMDAFRLVQDASRAEGPTK